MDGLDLSHRIRDCDGSLVEPNDPRCEGNGDCATATRGQACSTIVTLAEVAFDKIAREVHGCRVRNAWIIEKCDGQRRAAVTFSLIPKIQSRARSHSQRAGRIGRQLHWETATVNFAVRGCAAGPLESVQFEEIIQGRN